MIQRKMGSNTPAFALMYTFIFYIINTYYLVYMNIHRYIIYTDYILNICTYRLRNFMQALIAGAPILQFHDNL